MLFFRKITKFVLLLRAHAQDQPPYCFKPGMTCLLKVLPAHPVPNNYCVPNSNKATA